MNASILPGVIEITAHYRRALSGFLLGAGRFFVPIFEIRSRLAANLVHASPSVTKPPESPTIPVLDPAGGAGFYKECFMAIVTTDSGLKYEDLTVGEGAEAVAGKSVSVHYTGWLTDGQKFDSSPA